MPRHPFKKFTTGEKLAGLPKELLNAVVEQQRGFVPGGGGALKNLIPNSTIVKVKNESGAWRERYDILGLDGPLITPTQNEREFKREVTFSGITPTTASHSSKFCILLEPLADGAIGKAVVAGVVHVRLTGADVGFAVVTNNDATKLTADSSGAAGVLWAEAGSSERWAIVDLSRSGNSSPQYAYATRVTSQTIPTGNAGTPTAVQLTLLDSSNGVTLVTEAGFTGVLRIDGKAGATFSIASNITFAANATGDRSIHVTTYNSTPVATGSPARHYTPAPPAYAGVLSCAGAFVVPTSPAYVQVQASQNTGGNLNLSFGSLFVQEVV